jgi:hypothetical protein
MKSHAENVKEVTELAMKAAAAALESLPGPGEVTVEYGGVKITLRKPDIPATGVQTEHGLSHGDAAGIGLPNIPKLPED